MQYPEGAVRRVSNQASVVGVDLATLAQIPGLSSIVASTYSVRPAGPRAS